MIKKIIFFGFLSLSISFVHGISPQVNAAGANPYCLGVTGKFSAVNWPGGTIDVACAGDTGTAGCTGHKVTLSPGQSYDFNNCTCAPYGTEGDNGTTGLKGGCIWVGKNLNLYSQANGNILVKGDTSMPAGCSLTGGDPIACGSNGQVITSNFTISCTAPTPTPTPTPSTYSWNGYVVKDNNQNCTRESTDTAYQGAALTLTGSSTLTGITDANGVYTFKALASGSSYTMTLKIPSGYIMAPCNDNTRGPYTTTVNKSNTFYIIPSPTSTPTPTRTPTPSPTPIPTNTPIPTATPVPLATRFSLTVFLHGIGNSGDNLNPNTYTLSNHNPVHPQRSVSVEVIDSAGQVVLTKSGLVNFNTTNGNFTGTIDMGTALTGGSYNIRVKSPQYLKRRVLGIQTITPGQLLTISPITLVTGDVDGDNRLTILDYDIIIGCYSDFAPPESCSGTQGADSDLTDDGHVNQFDYNLFLRDFNVQSGD